VGDVQVDGQINIVMHQSAAGVSINPAHDVILGPGDNLLVIAPMERLLALEAVNHAADAAK
jgi:voltage-gated potassium channel